MANIAMYLHLVPPKQTKKEEACERNLFTNDIIYVTIKGKKKHSIFRFGDGRGRSILIKIHLADLEKYTNKGESSLTQTNVCTCLIRKNNYG